MTDTTREAVEAEISKAQITSGMIKMGERISWGSDSAAIDRLSELCAALLDERDAARAAHDGTWNAAIDAAEDIAKERAAELSDRSRRPVYTVAHRIRSLLRIRPEDQITDLDRA